MPDSTTTIRIFIASPDDVQSERDSVGRAIDQLKGEFPNVRILTIRSETHTTATVGADAISTSLSQMQPERTDIFVLIMWHKYGTRRAEHESGTIAEYQQANEARHTTGRPLIMPFFCEEAPPYDNLDTVQFEKVRQFRRSLEGKGIVKVFDSRASFDDLCLKQLRLKIEELLAEAPGQLGATTDWTGLRDAINAAQDRIREPIDDYEYVRTTPLRRSPRLEQTFNCAKLFLKLENIQNSGSFKIRGATNAVALQHAKDPHAIFVAASAGNHGLGLAVAAQHRGHQCHVFMPLGTPLTKRLAIERYKATIHMEGQNFDETQDIARRFAQDSDFTYVHPYNDFDVVAGQGTIGLELVSQYREMGESAPDCVIIPSGGGGLAAGIATVLSEEWPDSTLVATEPKSVPSLTASHGEARPRKVIPEPTIADGVAVAEVGDNVHSILNDLIGDVWQVSEDSIATAISRLIENVRIVAEGAAACTLGAMEERHANDHDIFRNKSILLVISGGNLDISTMSSVLQRAMVLEKRRTHFRFTVRDVPRILAEITSALGDEKLNIKELTHARHSDTLNFGWAFVDVFVETEGGEHAHRVWKTLRGRGFMVDIVTTA